MLERLRAIGGRTIKFGAHLQEPAKFVFNYEPKPKLRARHGANGATYTPKETEIYENGIAQATKLQHTAGGPFLGRIFIEIHFYVSSWRGDIDNYVKAILDGMQERRDRKTKMVLFSGAFKNDNQVDGMYVRRWDAPKGKERTEVTITKITDHPQFTEDGCPCCGAIKCQP